MKLFDPITIRGMELKNRIIFPALGVGSQSLGTEKTGKIIDFWAERVRGGAAAVVLGAVPPSLLIPDEELGQSISPDKYIKALNQLADAVHRAGGRFGVQLWHINRYPSSLIGPASGPQEWVAPSPRIYKAEEKSLVYMPSGEDMLMRELTAKEIEAIITRFARASVQIKEAGTDFVEIHMAHGHLPNQFFSPLTNRRRDRYGGDLTGRMKFGIECIRAIRAAVGDSYPVFVRFAAEDEEGSGGTTLAESTAYAVDLERAGVDCLDVSVGMPGKSAYSSYCCPPKKQPMGTYAHLAEAIRKSVSIPVVAVGRINTAQVAEEILAKGQADLVAIGRQLICDPYWPQKIAENRFKEVVACDSCNTYCWGIGPKGERPKSLCRKAEKAG
ncbi:MAG: NADH:flavin oxidoreductase [Dehalococcoidia bacterium]